MKIKVQGTVVSVSGTKNEATVRIGGVAIVVSVPEGEKSKLLEQFGQGVAFVTVELDVAGAVLA